MESRNDLRPWFTKFNAKVIDKRWMPVVKVIYVWHHTNESYLRNERSLARVGLVYSQQTGTFYGGEKAQEKVENPLLGMYQALVEARIPFAMVHDQLLDFEVNPKVSDADSAEYRRPLNDAVRTDRELRAAGRQRGSNRRHVITSGAFGGRTLA